MIQSIEPQVSILADPLTIKIKLEHPQPTDWTVEYIVDSVALQHKIVICQEKTEHGEVALVTSKIEDCSL